jgi:rhamnose utilization protein RhaD (predicted bifunctional aldolase and dehydrogenase)
LPHKVVVHVHCVDTTARAVQEDAHAKLSPLLSGLEWIFVPYIRPGMPLSRMIVERRQSSTTILILANHGLVVRAESVTGAAQLLMRRRDCSIGTPKNIGKRWPASSHDGRHPLRPRAGSVLGHRCGGQPASELPHLAEAVVAICLG